MGEKRITPGEPEQLVASKQPREWEITILRGEVGFGKTNSLNDNQARRKRVEGERHTFSLSTGEELWAYSLTTEPAIVDITKANFSTSSTGDTGGDGGDVGDGVDINADPVVVTPYVRGDKTTVTTLVTGADGGFKVTVRDENNPDLKREYTGGASDDVFEETALFTSNLQVRIEDTSGGANTINYGVRVD